MNFQIIKDDFYPNICKCLNEMVPEFHSIFDDGETYPILGEFGEFIIVQKDNSKIISKCFNFINYAFETGGYETDDVIVIQVYEQLYNIPLMDAIAKKYLKGKALEKYVKFVES